MPANISAYHQLKSTLGSSVTLVAVSKTKPDSDILELYEAGQRDFGENYVQELIEKAARLPKDIRWHFIGHLQTNKVKQIIPLVYLVHGVDSQKLLYEIDKQSAKEGIRTKVLLQLHISDESTKFGLSFEELSGLVAAIKAEPGSLANVELTGLMGMASFTDNMGQVKSEFSALHQAFLNTKIILGEGFNTLSMGMSGDYRIAIEQGSTMIRIGSMLFGEREKKPS